MKKFAKTALIAAGLSLSFGATAKTDASYLADCKASVKQQFDNVSKIKVANINSRRNVFKAKLRVKVDGERSMVLCEIRDNQEVALNCLKGAACSSAALASK